MDDSPPDPEKSNQVEEKERVRRHVGQAKKKHDLGTSSPPPLDFVTSTLLPQGHTLIHLSGCTIGLSRTASSTEGNSLKLSP